MQIDEPEAITTFVGIDKVYWWREYGVGRCDAARAICRWEVIET